jgi:hypothetical protein
VHLGNLGDSRKDIEYREKALAIDARSVTRWVKGLGETNKALDYYNRLFYIAHEMRLSLWPRKRSVGSGHLP